MTKMNKIMIGVIAVLSVSTVAMGVKLISNNKEEEAVDVMVSNVKEGTTAVTDVDGVDITSTFTTTITSVTTTVTTTTTEPLTTTTTVVEVNDGIPKTADEFYEAGFKDGYANLNDVDGYLNVRKTPDSSGEVLCTIGYHNMVYYLPLESTPGWYMTCVNGVLGYVSADYVVEGIPPEYAQNATSAPNNNGGGNSGSNGGSGDASLIEKFPLTARLPMTLHSFNSDATYRVDSISYRIDQDVNGQYKMNVYQFTVTNVSDAMGVNNTFDDKIYIFNEAGEMVAALTFDFYEAIPLGESTTITNEYMTYSQSSILPGNYYLGDSDVGTNLEVKWGVEHNGYYDYYGRTITEVPDDIWEFNIY